MKNTSPFLLLFLLLLVACVPAAPTSTVSPSIAPVSIGDCLITPHEYARMGNAIPYAVLINKPGTRTLDLLWRDGSSLGNWQTLALVPHTNAHLTGPASKAQVVPLVFLESSENGLVQLNTSLGGQVSKLIDLPSTVTVAGLIGIPEKPVVAYATIEALADGSGLRSQIFLGDLETIATAKPLQTMDSSEGLVLLPVAIHHEQNDTPDGLWYTTSLWGVGGDSMVDPRSGLYYLDLGTGKSLEFLSSGCSFSDLSTGQNWVTWASKGTLFAADLHSGKTVSFALLAGNDLGPVHALIGPGDGYITWLEGRTSESDGGLETTLRIGTLEGYLIGDYPLTAFVAPSGLGEGIALTQLGWMAAENYNVVVEVYGPSTGQTVLVSLDANTGQMTRLGEGNFAGFAYP
jgi:hypothetical protein